MLAYYYRSKKYQILISDHKIIISSIVRFIEATTSEKEIIIAPTKEIENGNEGGNF